MKFWNILFRGRIFRSTISRGRIFHSIIRRSKVAAIFMALGLLFLTGCGTQGSAAVSAGSASSVHNVVDDLGRRVRVPNQPQRVLALSRNCMDDLYELGITVVGKVDEYSNRPELKALPSISRQASPNLEVISQLKPDLILANTRQHAQMLESLQATGAAVVFIDPSKVRKDPLTDEITFVGEITGRQSQAQDYVKHLQATCDQLKAKIAPAGFKTSLFMQGGGEGIKVAQPTGFYGLLLVKLGIENIVPKDLPGSSKDTWVSYDAETILQKNPDLILLKSSSNDPSQLQATLNSFLQNPAWKDLKAVKNKKVFVLPGKIQPGGVSTEDALKMTAKIIDSQAFQ